MAVDAAAPCRTPAVLLTVVPAHPPPHSSTTAGTLAPVIDREYALEDVQAAHDYMESNASTGKLVLRVRAD